MEKGTRSAGMGGGDEAAIGCGHLLTERGGDVMRSGCHSYTMSHTFSTDNRTVIMKKTKDHTLLWKKV